MQIGFDREQILLTCFSTETVGKKTISQEQKLTVLRVEKAAESNIIEMSNYIPQLQNGILV